MTPKQIAAINRLAQRGHGIDRIDDIIPEAVVVGRQGWRVTCESEGGYQMCTAYDNVRPGDKVVCAKVKLYDRPAMRWFAFKSDAMWCLDEMARTTNRR